jgi:hypothetical protein
MAVSVSTFISENHHKIKDYYGYKKLLKDFERAGSGKPFSISYDMVAKGLLANYYGHVAEDRLCHAFKKFAREHTEFPGRVVDEG